MKKEVLLGVFFIFFILVFSIFVCAQLANTPSPTLKGDLKRTGQSIYETHIEQPYLKWKFYTGNGVESAPAIGPDRTLYFAHFGGNLFALNPDGTQKWKFSKEGERFSSSPTVDSNGVIYFISTADMREEFNPTFDDYESFGIPTLYAINPDGTEKWTFVLGGLASGILYSPAIDSDGTIYSISGGAKKAGLTEEEKVLRGDTFWAVNPDGTEKWRFKVGDAMYSAPAIGDDGIIYFGCADGYLYALKKDGTEKWKFKPENLGELHSFSAVPSVGPDGTIYAGSKNKNLYAVNSDGTLKWIFPMLDKVEATPSFGLDGTIYTGAYSPSADPYLYAINPNTGKEIWKFKTGQGVYGSPTVDKNGILYFGSYDSYLYSLTADGKERWRYKTEGGVTMPPVIDSDGTIYFGSWDYYLYAVDGIERDEGLVIGAPEKKGEEKGKELPKGECDPECTNSSRCTVCDDSYSPAEEVERKSFFSRIVEWFKRFFRG